MQKRAKIFTKVFMHKKEMKMSQKKIQQAKSLLRQES
jgi:hypothetical protein